MTHCKDKLESVFKPAFKIASTTAETWRNYYASLYNPYDSREIEPDYEIIEEENPLKELTEWIGE